MSAIEIPELPLQLIMLVGLPKAGLSTAAQKISSQYQFPVVSYDSLFHAITGGVYLGRIAERVADLVCDVIGYYLHQGQSVVYDASNLTRDQRKRVLQVARHLGVPTCAVWVQCSPGVRKQRAAAAGCSSETLRKLESLFESPQLYEGFALVSTHIGEAELAYETALDREMEARFDRFRTRTQLLPI